LARPDQLIHRSIAEPNQLLAVTQLLGQRRSRAAALLARYYERRFALRSSAAGRMPAPAIAENPELRSCAAARQWYRVTSAREGRDTTKQGRHITLPGRAMISAKVLRQRTFWQGTWTRTLMFAVVSVTCSAVGPPA